MYRSVNLIKSISSEGVFSLNKSSFDDILKNSHSKITLQLPIQGQLHDLELDRSELFGTNFYKTYNTQQISSRNLGTHYQGKLNGYGNSKVAVSFTELGIVGLILDGTSQFEICPLGDSNYQVLEINQFPDFQCGAEFHSEYDHELKESTRDNIRKAPNGDMILKAPTATTRCINVYWEGDTDIYQIFSGNSEAFLTSLFNASQMLFSADGIQVYLADVFVNSGTSFYFSASTPSSVSAFSMLSEFGNVRPTFNGMAAQLFSFTKGSGGIAWLDYLCIQPYAFSRLYSTTVTQPFTYSWNVMVATHEHGHTFGSPHTFSCSWNTNNFQPGDNPRGCTRIDSCRVECGAPLSSGCTSAQLNPGLGFCTTTSSTDCGVCCAPDYCCGLPGIPPQGGTIMSYCHQVSVGINFNLGFGPQPRQRIIDEINSLPSGCIECLGPPDETQTPTPTVTSTQTKTPTPTKTINLSPNPTSTPTVTPTITKTKTPNVTPTTTITKTPTSTTVQNDCQYCLSLHPCSFNKFFWECCEPYSSIRIYTIPDSVVQTLVNGDTYYVEAVGFSGCAVYDATMTTADFSYEYINIITP